MTSSLGDANAMAMLGLVHQNNNFQPLNSIPNFNQNPMTISTGKKNPTNFGN